MNNRRGNWETWCREAMGNMNNEIVETFRDRKGCTIPMRVGMLDFGNVRELGTGMFQHTLQYLVKCVIDCGRRFGGIAYLDSQTLMLDWKLELLISESATDHQTYKAASGSVKGIASL